VDGERIIAIDPRAIQPNPKQPRVSFDEESLQELASSIAQDGVVEPVIVRRKVDAYELVSGERRVRACILAGLDSVPAIVRDVSDADMLKIGLIENIQREDLTAVELARAYQALLDEFKWTQEVLAEQVGKKRATVSNTLRLLNLPPEVQEKVADSSISMGHARALLALPTRHAQIAACRAIIQRGLSVRQVEKMAAPTQPKRAASPRDPNIAALEDELRRRLGTRVTLHAGKGTKGRGRIEIEYYSLDDLDRILNLLRASH
jgi:ParB family chromosome partitioning protein